MLSLRRKFLAVYGHDQVPPVGLDELKRLSGSKQKPSVGYGAANLLIPDSYGGGVGGSGVTRPRTIRRRHPLEP